ncbi:MAG: hypothetical protein ACRC8K_05310, partial [Waterburya sp.]
MVKRREAEAAIAELRYHRENQDILLSRGKACMELIGSGMVIPGSATAQLCQDFAMAPRVAAVVVPPPPPPQRQPE